MARLSLLHTGGKTLGGLFLSATGSWLLVVCLGGLLTLGVLSLLHIGILLSLGCIGVCLLVAGACVLYGVVRTAASTVNTVEDQAMASRLPKKTALPSEVPRVSSYHPYGAPRSSRVKAMQTATQGTRSPHLFDS
jgi:hypothetical protein